MNAGNYRFKLNYSSLWHLWHGGSAFVQHRITIQRVVFLPDVSKYQGLINWVKMRLAGVDGVIIKCGQATLKDPQFDTNWGNAKGQLIPRGTYWFFDSRVPPKQQAVLWWEWIKNDPGELAHLADYEESYNGSYGGHQNFKIFLDEFKRISGGRVEIGIYTGYYYWISHSPTSAADLGYFSQFPLWLAWYTNNPAVVIIPKPWTDLLFWQYGTTPPLPVSDYGVQSLELDSNNFNGDEESYRYYFDLNGSTPPPPAPVADEYLLLTENGVTRKFIEVK